MWAELSESQLVHARQLPPHSHTSRTVPPTIAASPISLHRKLAFSASFISRTVDSLCLWILLLAALTGRLIWRKYLHLTYQPQLLEKSPTISIVIYCLMGQTLPAQMWAAQATTRVIHRPCIPRVSDALPLSGILLLSTSTPHFYMNDQPLSAGAISRNQINILS